MFIQPNNNNSFYPNTPYFLGPYNPHYNDPDFMSRANYVCSLIEGTKKAINRQSAIFKVEQQNPFSYRIRCDSTFAALVRTLDGTLNIFNWCTFEPYKEHPLISQIKAVQQQSFPIIGGLNFTVDYAHSVNTLYSAFLDKNTAEHRCDVLNQKIVLLRHQCQRAGFGKQCHAYEASAKEKMKIVKKQLTQIFHHYPSIHITELFLYSADTQKYSFNHVIFADYINKFIKKLQQTSLYAVIKDYFWRLELNQSNGYHYVFNCFVDKQDVPDGLEAMLGKLWHEVINQSEGYCINGRQLINNHFPQMYNLIEIFDQYMQQELLRYLLASIELEKYLDIDSGKYAKNTFGVKEIVKPQKKRNVA